MLPQLKNARNYLNLYHFKSLFGVGLDQHLFFLHFVNVYILYTYLLYAEYDVKNT